MEVVPLENSLLFALMPPPLRLLFERALALDPAHARARCALANMHEARGDVALAEHVLQVPVPALHMCIEAEDGAGGLLRGVVRASATATPFHFELEPQGESQGWFRAAPTSNVPRLPVDWQPPSNSEAVSEFDEVLQDATLLIT